MLGDCPITWTSRLQTEIALSTTEAEYIALSSGMRELLPTRSLLEEVVSKLDLKLQDGSTTVKSTVFEDNNGALSMATAPRHSPRPKHIAVKYHFFKSHINNGSQKDTGINIERVDTNVQKADIFTKGLDKDKFQSLQKMLMGW